MEVRQTYRTPVGAINRASTRGRDKSGPYDDIAGGRDFYIILMTKQAKPHSHHVN